MTDDITKRAITKAVLAAMKAQEHRGEAGLGPESMSVAIAVYENALWQPVDDPAKVPRDEWMIIYNDLTGFSYPRLYHEKEAIGVNVTAWRPGIKPPRSADDH